MSGVVFGFFVCFFLNFSLHDEVISSHMGNCAFLQRLHFISVTNVPF